MFAVGFQEIVDLTLDEYQTLFGDVALVPNYAFETDPPRL